MTIRTAICRLGLRPSLRLGSDLAAAAGLAAILAVAGCHRPQGALIPYSGGSHTYWSTETSPQSVRLRDLRSDEIIFSMDIPAGKQLVLEFKDGEGDDPAQSPDLMRYKVMKLGETTGKLTSSMSVPAFASRRLELYIRPGTEYAQGDADQALRTDTVTDRPDWWTPKGGEMPEDPRGVASYDD